MQKARRGSVSAPHRDATVTTASATPKTQRKILTQKELSKRARLKWNLIHFLATVFLFHFARNQTIHSLVSTTQIDVPLLVFWLFIYGIMYIITIFLLMVVKWILAGVISHTKALDIWSTEFIVKLAERFSIRKKSRRPVIIACLIFAFSGSLLYAINAPIHSSLSEQYLQRYNVPGKGDTINFILEPYPPPYEDTMPRHVHHLMAPESKFNSDKYLTIFSAIISGIENAIESKLSIDPKFADPNGYLEYFQSSDMSSKIPSLALDNIWKEDSVFASQWVRGINPLTIHRIKTPSFPEGVDINESVRTYLESEVLYPSDNIASLLKRREIFYANTKILEKVPKWKDCFRYAPITVFYLCRACSPPQLLPLLIQLNVTDGADEVLVPPPRSLSHLPEREREKDPRWIRWIFAKMHVASSDAQIHEVHHVWYHLFLEPVIVSMYRQFKAGHPVFDILKPHTRHTLAINELGRETLLEVGGFFDSITSVGSNGTMGLIVEMINNGFNFTDLAFPLDMERRGFEETDLRSYDADPLPGYLFRDYGYRLWRIYRKYVDKILSKIYASDAEVKADMALQNWALEVSDPKYGNLRGFPTSFETRDKLSFILTHFIFLATVDHSTCSSQFDFYGFIPNRPMCIRRPVPPAGNITWIDVCKALPNMYRTRQQMSIAYTLSVSPTLTMIDLKEEKEYIWPFKLLMKLMSLDNKMWKPRHKAEFSDMVQDLIELTDEMKLRNRVGGFTYDYLYVENMPVSIDI